MLPTTADFELIILDNTVTVKVNNYVLCLKKNRFIDLMAFILLATPH